MLDTDALRGNVARLCRGFLMAFAGLTVLLAYWHVLRAPALRADPHNPRANERIKLTEPGRVVTADGRPILVPARSEEQWYYEYPGGEDFCHLTGYSPRTGMQPALRDALYAQGPYEDPWCRVLRGRPMGCQVTLTINAAAQVLATRLMRGHRGAVVAVDPRDGAIRVMVSAPSYDPAGVLASHTDFEIFQNLPTKPELNRALLGQYPPGSVLKILTAAAALAQGVVKPEDEFTCSGQVTIDHDVIPCRREGGHGKITFTDAFTDSCNVIFAELGQGLGPSLFHEYVDRFHLLDRPELPLPARGGRMAAMKGPNADAQVAEAAIGQGATLVSPAAIARLAATIASGGQVPALQLIQRVTSPGGRALYQLSPRSMGQAIDPRVAKEVTRLMVATVERGTGVQGRIRGVTVAGKTGSAQNPSGPPHAWFAAFAPAGDPRVAVAVVVENGGAGGEVAAPIARQVMEVLLSSGAQ